MDIKSDLKLTMYTDTKIMRNDVYTDTKIMMNDVDPSTFVFKSRFEKLIA